MTMAQCLREAAAAGAIEIYCTRLTPTWLMVHVDLGEIERLGLAKTLNRVAGNQRRVTVAEASW